MKTDRELLELAAKAAGIDYLPAETDKGKECELKFGFWLNMQGEVPDYVRRRWQPLTDDGDALRLAVKLKINLEHMETIGRAPFGINAWPVSRGDCGASEDDSYIADPFAATRRAIARAAAAIGETL